MPFAFAVSMILYIVALAVAPFEVSANSQFFLLCAIEHKRKNWLFSDTPDGATANARYLTIVEMAKLAPWNAEVQEKCSNKTE